MLLPHEEQKCGSEKMLDKHLPMVTCWIHNFLCEAGNLDNLFDDAGYSVLITTF